MMEMSYYGSLIMLNVLMLCKYEYFKDDGVMRGLLEEIITVVVYWMMILIIVKLVWEYVPWPILRSILCK